LLDKFYLFVGITFTVAKTRRIVMWLTVVVVPTV